jgi:hypothetical protein
MERLDGPYFVTVTRLLKICELSSTASGRSLPVFRAIDFGWQAQFFAWDSPGLTSFPVTGDRNDGN